MSASRTCKTCLRELPWGEFYNSQPLTCKSCVREQSQRWREQNYDRYLTTARRSTALYKRQKRDQHNANQAVRNAVKRGELTRPTSCEDCGRQCRPEAHHEDYSRRLDVQWLCRTCHIAADQLKRARDRAAVSSHSVSVTEPPPEMSWA